MDAKLGINAAKQKSADAISRPQRSQPRFHDPPSQATRDDCVPDIPPKRTSRRKRVRQRWHSGIGVSLSKAEKSKPSMLRQDIMARKEKPLRNRWRFKIPPDGKRFVTARFWRSIRW